MNLTLLAGLLVLMRMLECVSTLSNQEENDIINQIITTQSYKKNSRPLSQLKISVHLSIKQISGIDEKNQFMISDSYLAASWTDPRLKWTPTNYNNNSNILIPSSLLWMPDFYQINSVNTNEYINIGSSSSALVVANCTVYVVFNLAQAKTRCKLSLKYSPFDTQICSIVIGSWMMDTKVLDILSDKSRIDSSSYMEHPIWELKQMSVTSIISSDRYFLFGKEIETEDISFDFVLKRRPLYFMMNNIFPCLVLNAVLILLFSLPYLAQVASCNCII